MDNSLSSNFIGKQVISDVGQLYGTCKTVLFDSVFKKLNYLIVFDDNENIEYEQVFLAKNVISVGESAIIIKKCNPQNMLDGSSRPIINTCVISEDGKFLGQVTDVILLNNAVSGIILTDGTVIEREKIVTAGFDAILVNLKKALPACSKRVTTKSAEKLSEIEIKENEFFLLPRTVVANYSLLLNRRVKKDIYNLKNELIIKKDTLISVSVIELAKFSGKLFELTVNSLTNIL